MAEKSNSPFPLLTREAKPRERGLTLISDRFSNFEKALVAETSESIDYARIAQSLPLLIDRSLMLERIRNYHDFGIKVMSEGTIIEVGIKKDILAQLLEKLRSLGFDTVEVGENAVDMSKDMKSEIKSRIDSLSMDCIFKVGKKDPRNPPSAAYLISKIEEVSELKGGKVIIEAGEGTNSGVYDSSGKISWDLLNELVGRFGPPNLIFEAPKRSQRTDLILEFGPGVNIAGIEFVDVLDLEMQRLGLTTETLGLAPSVRNVEGSPAVKFIYHLIRTEHPIDQPTLMQKSGLPKRTLQAGLSYLIEQGVVREVSDMSDLRRHKYTPR